MSIAAGGLKNLLDAQGSSWLGRRVTVAGLGKSGEAAARLLCRAGARVRISELGQGGSLRARAEALKEAGVDAVELGGHCEAFVAKSELVVISPGIAETSPILRFARDHSIPVLSEIELAFLFCKAEVIAVTGTNGKSSVVTMIAKLVQGIGRQAVACGNLGLPFSEVAADLASEALAVVEVSSFQLTRCERFHPRIAVLLNLGTNHLDRHQNHIEYRRAKERIFQRQGSSDWAVLNGSQPEIVALAHKLKAQRVWFSNNQDNPPEFHLSDASLSALNENAQAVLQIGRVLGIPDPISWQSIRAFRGLEHRLERVGTVRGVTFINDSKSTTPDSFLYALSRVNSPVVCILGGRDKGLDFHLLVEACLGKQVRSVVLLGECREHLAKLLGSGVEFRQAESLQEAVQCARELASPGETVLFSPACASFDLFESFESRGRAFKDLVQSLREEANGQT